MNRIALLIVLVASVATFVGCPKKQTVGMPDYDILVAQDGSGDYTSIQDAIDDASDGDLIYVKAGVYEEEVEIEDRDDINLMGAGPDRAIIDADDEYAAVTLASDGCRLSGFTLTNASSHGVYLKDGHHSIHRCLITDNGDRGIYFTSFSGDPSASIDHCTIVENDVSGIYSPTDHRKTSITNCIIADNGRGIVSDDDEGNMRIDYNCVYEDGSEFDRVTEGKGNIIEDPEYDGDFRLEPGSPCIGAASDGTNMGCF